MNKEARIVVANSCMPKFGKFFLCPLMEITAEWKKNYNFVIWIIGVGEKMNLFPSKFRGILGTDGSSLVPFTDNLKVN